jgi:hypothetical protein
MKPTRVLLLIVATLAFSCSKDDDAKPKLESTGLSFSGETQLIKAPSAMLNSSDPYAQLASSWIEAVNGIGAFTTYFKTPSGATKTSSKITASNGRVAAPGDYVVYTWTDSQTGYSIAYQVSEESDRYTWEIFFKESLDAEWLKYIHAEEMKDRSSGFMKIFDIWGFLSDDSSSVMVSYNWTRSGDIFTFEMDSPLFELNVKLTYNTRTKAGSVIYYFDGIKTYEMTWDSKGNGTWTLFDENGNVEEQGTWSV